MSFNTANPGQTMTVNFTLANGGGQVGEQDILLTLENGTKTTVDQLNNVSLQGGNSGQYSLVWDIPTDQTLQFYKLAIESEDDIDIFRNPLNVPSTGATFRFGENPESDIINSLAASDSRAYIGYNSNYVVSVDNADGSKIWSHTLHSQKVFRVFEDNGMLYSTSYDGTLKAVDESDGSLLWSESISDRVVGLYKSDKLYVGAFYNSSSSSDLIALDNSDRSEIWRQSSNSFYIQQIYEYEGKVFAGNSFGEVIALDSSDGSEIWGNEIHTGDIVGLGVYGGTVYTLDDEGNLIATDASDGSEIWSTNTRGIVSEAMYVYRGTIYVGGEDRVLEALDGSDGSLIWTTDIGANDIYSIVVYNGIVYLGGVFGTLTAAELTYE